jgi:hypothetical protein
MPCYKDRLFLLQIHIHILVYFFGSSSSSPKCHVQSDKFPVELLCLPYEPVELFKALLILILYTESVIQCFSS